MVLEIFIESEDAEGEKRRVLVERWVFRHDPDPEGLGSGGGSDVKSPEKALSVSAAYKQLVVFFRTLHAELRALPAHRYARRAAERLLEDVEDVESARAKKASFAVAFAIRGESREAGRNERMEVWKPPPLERAQSGTRREKQSAPPISRDSGTTVSSETSASLGMSGVSSSGTRASSSEIFHSSSSEGSGATFADDKEAASRRSRPSLPRTEQALLSSSEAYETYAFAAAAAPGGGRLDASVYFLDADALRALDLGDAPFGARGERAHEEEPSTCFRDASLSWDGRRRVSVPSRSVSGSDEKAGASPGGCSVSGEKRDDKKVAAEQKRPRRAGSWKARATQFLATSPGSVKNGFAARPDTDDVDTPPPPSRVGIVLAGGAGAGGTPPSGGSRGLLSAEMARFEPDRVGVDVSGVIHPSSFVENRQEKLCYGTPASGPATPSSASRPPLSPLTPASAPVSGPAPIFGFAEAEGFRSASPAGAGSSRGSSGGGFLSALASRLASSPGVAIPGVPGIPGMGTLPFAFGSSGSRGSGSAASLASPAHALAARAAAGPAARLTAHAGSLSPAQRADSPPWHFRGLMVPSGSPGATTPWRADRHPNVGTSVSRRASWSSPSSSLSVSFQEFPGAAASRVPGGPFAYGTSPRCAALGSSPESVAGTAGSAPRDPSRLAAPGGDAGDPREGRRLAAASAAELADDALPFALDVEDDDDGRRDGARGAGAGGETPVVEDKTSKGSPGRIRIDPFDSDAAVAALVRALRDAPPLGLEPGSGGAPAREITLAGAKRRLASIRREAAMARRHRGGASSSDASSRASSEAEKRDDPPRRSSRPGSAGAPAPAPGGEKNDDADAARTDEAEPPTAASIAVDAAVDEALAFAEPAGGR